MKSLRRSALWCTAWMGVGLLAPAAVMAQAIWTPSTVFVQAGVAEDASALVAGATWDWGWRKPHRWGVFTGYWEVSFGRWASRTVESRSHAWVTQAGLTPVLRLDLGEPGGWYAEGGIGANVLLPVYRSQDKRFSTKFNFGDHLALGHTFGQGQSHDVALRFQHFSNAGIRKPNPGEDFLQLRYSRRF